MNTLTEIKSTFDKLKINLSDTVIQDLLEVLFKTESIQPNHDLQQWVYVDLQSDFVKKTDLIEEIDWEDLKYWLKGERGKFLFIKTHHPETDSYKCNVDSFFKSAEDLQKIEGIYSYDFVSIKDVIVLDHNDGADLPFMRLMCSLETPSGADIDQLGFSVEGEIISPVNNKFILFDPSKQHEAWNHTNQWWKFFIIDIKRSYL
jgi:hypothetical protein